MDKQGITVGIMSCVECEQHNLAMIVVQCLRGPFFGLRKINDRSIYKVLIIL